MNVVVGVFWVAGWKVDEGVGGVLNSQVEEGGLGEWSVGGNNRGGGGNIPLSSYKFISSTVLMNRILRS